MGRIRVVPLGGLGEIGMNCLALESPEGVLVVDCGITFPHEERGVDVIHPLFEYLEERTDDVVGVVVTHGHEDHIGAMPYLLRRVKVPVWAPPYAVHLIQERLREFPDVHDVDLRTTTPRRKFDVGNFEVEPLRVTHSIPDSTALAIGTPAGMVLHTGDFKLEDDPLDGETSDRERFEELGAGGVALLLSDSTNVDVPGTAGGERTVAAALRRLVESFGKRVVVGVFPSNVYRLRTLAEVAVATGRKICLLGRSVLAHARAASELGRLGMKNDLVVSPDRARDVPREQLLVIASGTQAEPQSALGRLAAGDHPRLALQSGDAVILSSRVIPGNERAIWDMICDLERRGVDVRFPSTDPDIHVSGHACREEQRRMLTWVRPRGFVPVHGTYHHLLRHAELAREMGVDQVELIENGQTVWLDDGALFQGATVHVGRVHVDAGSEVPVDVLRERSLMGEVGAVFVTVRVDRHGTLLGTPSVAARGIVTEGTAEETLDDARRAVEEAVNELRASMLTYSVETVREAVRRSARRVYARVQRKPMVVVTIQEG